MLRSAQRAALATFLMFLLPGCGQNQSGAQSSIPETHATERRTVPEGAADTTAIGSPMVRNLVRGALEQTEYTIRYDPSYVKLDYPGGDVPRDRGVCCDVVIRALRACGLDLQKEVHEDMRGDFSAYPKRWGLSRPDRNIDHRRVPNLMTYFRRMGKSLPVSDDTTAYRPGDIVVWDLGSGLLHIGMITNLRIRGTNEHYIVHNIGSGARVEPGLFAWKIIGHYRYFE